MYGWVTYPPRVPPRVFVLETVGELIPQCPPANACACARSGQDGVPATDPQAKLTARRVCICVVLTRTRRGRGLTKTVWVREVGGQGFACHVGSVRAHLPPLSHVWHAHQVNVIVVKVRYWCAESHTQNYSLSPRTSSPQRVCSIATFDSRNVFN